MEMLKLELKLAQTDEGKAMALAKIRSLVMQTSEKTLTESEMKAVEDRLQDLIREYRNHFAYLNPNFYGLIFQTNPADRLDFTRAIMPNIYN